MFKWLNAQGSEFKHHTPGETNYLSKLDPKLNEKNANGILEKPFPLNLSFRSEPILSEDLRNEIYNRVVRMQRSVRGVSVELGVDMRRVAAVVRLVELENKMKEQGKSLAIPYARAIHEMVPTTPLYDDAREYRSNPHENINDLPVHRLTDPQIFYPVSESRQFNRIDAGRAFSGAPALLHRDAARMAAEPDETIRRITQGDFRQIETVGKGEDEQQVLLPADARIPHPHLIANDRNRISHGMTEPGLVRTKYYKRLDQEMEVDQKRKERAQQRRERTIHKVQPENSRFEFRFRDAVVSAQTTGANGRGSQAPGHRYGVPSYDRKKGQVKIPTRVKV
ncbi:mitochondrial 37S ribosomal protein mS45 [Aspergillus homomorphus CBS 101889]|uniref:Eukaryotic mitochondrial regulator protein-domain-containing protein n=1 Tax=Aspergillus homomorphus (strain CBS 101889) TaxID=1450537 RepID=A0A395I3F1_ASPHC|nr:hypothetical protein BO97DRAFT_422693 [Aspergillus homomorphus CBS 101889]RAL14265.1 hypothetical protein BO97DRAFT_422693 [Aspergillus homomorphus CBS 101889]